MKHYSDIHRGRLRCHRLGRRRRHHGQAVVDGRLFGRGPGAGRLGKVRPRARIQQGRMAESQPERRRSLDERPRRGSATPSARTTKSKPFQARTAMAAWSAAARSPTAAAAGGICRTSFDEALARSDHSFRHRHGGLADHLRGTRALLHAGRMGNGHIRPSREFAVRRADVKGLSGPARASQKLRRAVQYRGGQTGIDRRSRASGDHYAALYGSRRVRQLRNLFGLRLSGARAIQFGRHRCCRLPRKPAAAKFA